MRQATTMPTNKPTQRRAAKSTTSPKSSSTVDGHEQMLPSNSSGMKPSAATCNATTTTAVVVNPCLHSSGALNRFPLLESETSRSILNQVHQLHHGEHPQQSWNQRRWFHCLNALVSQAKR
jgi:hypothetical protein